MSADFEKILVKDPRLDVADSIKYAVVKGGQNVTAAPFKAISESDSQVVWNIQVPSEQKIIDRRVLWSSTLQFTGSAESATIIYGITWSLASFPLHQLLSVMSATINNNTVSLNINDVLPAIVRLICNDDLRMYNSSSPTFADTLAVYPTDVYAKDLNNPLSSLWGCNNNQVPHRGCFAPYSNTGSSGTKYVFKLVEPVLISPFIFGNLKANGQGFYGIQNMNFVFNKSSFSKRCVRGNCVATDVSTSNGGTTPSSSLYFMFLTPHPSDLMPARNIVPYYELPRYITSLPSLAASTLANGPGNAAKDTAILNTLQLNQIPDKLIIYIRPTPTDTSTQPDVALPITGIQVNFNNNSGILATASDVQLWEMSRNNGLQNNWVEYSGWGSSIDFSGENNVQKYVGTVGSFLVLEFGKDIQLTEDFYACGSLGNFNLQVNVSYNNNTASTQATLQCILITMNSGVFVCERGTSSTYTGILTKQDVLEASQQDHYTHADVGRLVGGGFFDMIKSGVSSLGKKALEHGKEKLKEHGKKLLHHGMEKAKEHGKNALAKYLQ